MIEKSLDNILDSFTPVKNDKSQKFTTLTIWVSDDYKVKYDELQEKTDGQTGKKLKELVMAAIDKIYSKAI